jgi:hypothetical protein
MASLGFFHFVYDNLEATEFAIKSAREHYPDSYYILIGDGGVDHYDLAKKYNCDYLHNHNRVGYGAMPVDKVLESLKRVLVACLKTNTTHIMMMEDDVVILDKINIPDDSQLIGQPIGQINQIHPHLMEIAEKVSGVKPMTDYYCFGGGSILNVATFIEYFGRVYVFYETNLETLKLIYPQIGWIDCYLTYFYYLAGKNISLHSSFYTVSPWPTDIKDFDLNTVRGQFAVVDRYKNNYK